MYITKVVYAEREEMPEYYELDSLGVIHFTDYNTTEISIDSINEGLINYNGNGKDYINLIENNIGGDVLDALRNKQVDIVMVV